MPSLKNYLKADKMLIFLTAFILYLYSYFHLDQIIYGKWLVVFGLLISSYLIIISRKFKPLCIFFVFAALYQVNLISYYFHGVDISGGFDTFDFIQYYNETELIHFLFISSIAFFIPKINHPIYIKDYISYRHSPLIFWTTFLFAAFLIIFGLRGGGIVESGGYGNIEVETIGGTSLFEYVICLIPILIVTSKRTLIYKFAIAFIVIYFCFKGLSFGIRNQVLQLILMSLALYDNKALKYYKLILVGIIPLYIFLIYGAIRVNPFIIFSNNFTDILIEPFNNFTRALLGNQNDIFYASVRMLGMVEQGIISEIERINVLVYNLLAIILPYSFLPPIANLASYKQNIYGSLGGGLISMYWYVFMGYSGVIFIAYIIGKIFKTFYKTTNIFLVLYVLMILSTYPRWFGYNQISFFKISFFGVIFYYTLLFIENTIFTIQQPKKITSDEY